MSEYTSKRVLKEEVDELMALFTEEEEVRVENEEGRISNENGRIESENERVSSESERQSNEETRIDNENERIANHNCEEITQAANEATENATTAAEDAREAAKSDFNIDFIEPESVSQIQSGEILSVLFGKIEEFMDNNLIFLDNVDDGGVNFKTNISK